MKFLIAILLLSQFTFSQKNYVDPLLKNQVVEFIYEANMRGFDGQYIINSIDSIYFKSMDYPYMGLFYPKRNIIEISPHIYYNNESVRRVLFHEVAHKMGFKHTCEACDDILSVQSDLRRRSDKEWIKEVDDLFGCEKITEIIRRPRYN